MTLSIADGELLVLLGPSGCGKTTLLRMIAGLEQRSGGEIRIGGHRMDRHVPPRRRGIAMVFQSYALYPHRTVRENIAFPLRAAHAPRAEIEEKVRWAAEVFGLAPYLARYPRQLSGGERQRVALCRALVRDPQVLLLDEPLANLDAKLRYAARDELKRIQRRLRTTTVYVTHDQVEALGLGDRIAVMDHGRVRQVGTPQQIYNDPDDTFVATFVGQPPMNLVPAAAAGLAPGTVLGFRPEQFLPREARPGDRDVRGFRFHVSRVEYLGADRWLYGEVDGGGSPGAVIAKLPMTIGLPVAEGGTYDFGVPEAALCVFDQASGTRRRP